MASFVQGESVTCVISPHLMYPGKKYSATSIQDFKTATAFSADHGVYFDANVDNDKSWGGKPIDWLTTALVCRKDGREVNDMATLKRHLDNGCKSMLLIDETYPSADTRSINADRCARLYRELLEDSDGDVLEDFDCWAEDRMDDLETISTASPKTLAEILSVPSRHVCDLQFRIWDMMNQLKTDGFYAGYSGYIEE